MPNLVLSSTSPFRRELLRRLRIDFVTDKPEIDETVKTDETPDTLVKRLSLEKAQAVAERHPNALIIGSDQVAVIDHQILGKPLNHAQAVEQLSMASGNSVYFLTGLCLLDSRTSEWEVDVIPFEVHFRNLSKREIERYLVLEKPYNCAGSFKSEGLGITLFEKMSGDDPTSLIGLPLIRLVSMLRKAGYDVL